MFAAASHRHGKAVVRARDQARQGQEGSPTYRSGVLEADGAQVKPAPVVHRPFVEQLLVCLLFFQPVVDSSVMRDTIE